jgi:hypothetical protein
LLLVQLPRLLAQLLVLSEDGTYITPWLSYGLVSLFKFLALMPHHQPQIEREVAFERFK